MQVPERLAMKSVSCCPYIPLHRSKENVDQTCNCCIQAVGEGSACAWSASDVRVPSRGQDSNSTELRMHTGVKEQAALSGIADRRRCEAWPSFLCNVSIHPLARRGELQGQLECLAATEEYFIAKGWIPAKCILGTHSPPPAQLKYRTKRPFPHRHSARVAEGAKNTKNSPHKLTRDRELL